MEGDFDWLSPRPSGRLGAALVEAACEGVSGSLHLEGGGDADALWLRVKFDGRELFEPIGLSVLVLGRTRERGPFFFAGSFSRRPRRARQVTVEYGKNRLDAEHADEGWLCLLPSGAVDHPAAVTWLDLDGSEYETLHLHPLDEAGVLGPTPYGPPRFRS